MEGVLVNNWAIDLRLIPNVHVTLTAAPSGIILSTTPADHPFTGYVSVEGFLREHEDFAPTTGRPSIEFSDLAGHEQDVPGTVLVVYDGTDTLLVTAAVVTGAHRA